MHKSRKLRSKLAAFVAVMAMLFTVGASPAGAASGFGDVEDDAFFTEAVGWMVAESITSGIEPGCFGPADDVSRGQIAAFLFRLDGSLGNDPQTADHPFSDVTANYQQAPVGWLYAADISTGTSNTTFHPDAPITRGDFAALLWRYAGRPGGSPAHQFIDVTRGYQQLAISWMAAEHITTGTTLDTFSPEDQMTRAQAATFIWRFARPVESVEIADDTECVRPLRTALETGGLTTIEAACAVPFLSGFDADYLVSVVNGEDEADLAFLVALVQVVNAGCIADARIPQLIILLT